MCPFTSQHIAPPAFSPSLSLSLSPPLSLFTCSMMEASPNATNELTVNTAAYLFNRLFRSVNRLFKVEYDERIDRMNTAA